MTGVKRAPASPTNRFGSGRGAPGAFFADVLTCVIYVMGAPC
jgi:hypothetical protein